MFAVSGTIHLASKLNIAGNCTIAGQSAPGDGICIADQSVSLAGDNIIIRYLRIRMGDRYQNGGKVAGSGADDAFGGTKRKNIIIDHCSLSWSTDEVFSIYAGDSTTLQWNLIAEPLNYSYHFETGDTDFEKHGFGGIWGGQHLTAHHNLFAHCNSRTPRFDGIRNAIVEQVDFRNNVIYNWGNNNVYAGEGGQYNIVNNYYKYGPETKQQVQSRIVNPFHKRPEIDFGKFYVTGNFVDNFPEVSNNNWLGVTLDKPGTSLKDDVKMTTAFNTVVIPEVSATAAYDAVLNKVGALLPKRDTLDARIINNVINRTGRIIDVQGGFPHGTAYELTTKAWPSLLSAPALPDADNDGMPDSWERQQGLDVNSAADASAFKLHPSFTNIEVYLNSLIK